MRKRRDDDDEIGAPTPPPLPPEWDGQAPFPEWTIEAWSTSHGWEGVLWQAGEERGAQRQQRATAWRQATEAEVVQQLAATYRDILATEASRTFYVLSEPSPPEEDGWPFPKRSE